MSDLLSNLKNQKTKGKEKTEDFLEDDWNEVSDDDYEVETFPKKISNNLSSNVIEEKGQNKKYNNLKDIMGDSKHSNSNRNYNKPKQEKQEGFSGSGKPVFLNSNKFYNKNNTNSAENPRPNFENKNKNYQNTKFSTNNDYKNNDRNNYNTNSFTQRPKFFNNNPTEQKPNEVIENKYDINSNIIYSNRNNYNKNEKEETLRKVDLSALLKNNQEENAKIKPPKRDYTEIDFDKPKFQSYQTERKREEKVYLQKPQFKSSSNKETSNFVELDKGSDLYFKNTNKDKFNSQNQTNISDNLEKPTRFINSKKAAGNSEETFKEESKQ